MDYFSSDSSYNPKAVDLGPEGSNQASNSSNKEFRQVNAVDAYYHEQKGLDKEIPLYPSPGTDNQEVAYNFNSSGEVEVVAEPSFSKVSALVKILLLIFIPLSLIVGVGLFFTSQTSENAYRSDKSVILSVPMTEVNWQDLGTVFEPVIEIPVKTKSGYERWEFLLDSGAVISSLPREWADKMGKDLAFMKRSTFKGFGGVTSFAYQGEMEVLLGNEEKTLPVVFTEASSTKSLLGRKGFFEDLSVYFNHKEKRIEIRD